LIFFSGISIENYTADLLNMVRSPRRWLIPFVAKNGRFIEKGYEKLKRKAIFVSDMIKHWLECSYAISAEESSLCCL